MSQAHPTTTPEQCKTDTWLVFDPCTGIGPNKELLARVEVPRYSSPDSSGVRLDRDKRLSLAVARAIEDDDTVVRTGDGGEVPPERTEKWGFEVMTDMDSDIEYVIYEQNPSFDAVWDPENES